MRIKISVCAPTPGAVLAAVVLVSMAAAVALASGGPKVGSRAQSASSGEALDFKVHLQDYDPPNQAQVKTLLEGAKARFLSDSGGQILFTDAKLSNFATNGALESMAETPECVFDSAGRTISSARTLHMQTADQRFRLEGEGFFIQVTNSSLEISNRVNLTVRRMSRKPMRQ